MFRADEANRVIVSIHQPHFLPWIGYFNKVLQSDAFVWLNYVQYRKNYYQNRTKVKNANEELFWLTLPVHAKHDTVIDQVMIADSRWRVRISKTVEQCYRKAPYFAECWPTLSAAIMGAPDSLDKRHAVARGEDPAAARAREHGELTFGGLAELYFERHARPRKRSAGQDERMLRDVLGRPGKEPALIPAT